MECIDLLSNGLNVEFKGIEDEHQIKLYPSKQLQGHKDFKLVADGKNVSVFGNNATGKTSVIDSFMWLLFDKDNNNADTKFTIKPRTNLDKINHLKQ